MKKILITVTVLAVGFTTGFTTGFMSGKRTQQETIETLRQEVRHIAADFAVCLDEKEQAQRQVQAQAEHFRDCSWISNEQIVAVNGEYGHWLQLSLNGPGYFNPQKPL